MVDDVVRVLRRRRGGDGSVGGDDCGVEDFCGIGVEDSVLVVKCVLSVCGDEVFGGDCGICRGGVERGVFERREIFGERERRFDDMNVEFGFIGVEIYV